MEWRSTVDEEAVRGLLALPARESAKLMEAIRSLVRHPTQATPFFGHDAVGRPLSALTVDRHTIVFWVDHATKEVRIAALFLD